MNRYGYVLNNPLTFLDPSGHATLLPERQRTITFEGEDVAIVEHASGIERVIVRTLAGDNEAVTFSGHSIVCNGEIPDDSDFLLHELGHFRQARRMGAAYLPTYIDQYVAPKEGFRDYGDYAGDLAYKYHPMEIGANREQGLDPYYHTLSKPPIPSLHELNRLLSLPSLISGASGSSGDSGPAGLVGAPTVSPQGTLVVPVAGRPSDATGIPDNVELTIPAGYAPGGVGVVGVTSTNLSGGPANGGSWESPGGANAQADAEARRAAWEAAGSPDYNELRSRGVAGY